jgi:RNA polymerase sigma factor (sigma-70 family)
VLRARRRGQGEETLLARREPGPLDGDPLLLAKYRRGDDDTLALVFDAYAGPLAASVRAGIPFMADGQRMRIGQDLLEQEVEMIVQETFVRAFGEKARNSYDGVRPYRTWLFAIARNLLIDLARGRMRSPRIVALDDVDELIEEQRSPEEAAADGQLAALVTQFAEGLGEPEKSIYRLRYEENKSAREAGQALQMTEIQVRRRDAKLRDQLLAFLRRHGFLTEARVSFGRSLLPGAKSQHAQNASAEGDAT